MTQTKNDRRQIIVPQSMWDKVRTLAAARHSSASAEVREALIDYFARRSLESLELARERSKLAIG